MYYLGACPKLCPTKGGAHRLLRAEELQLDRLGLGQGGDELAAEDRRVTAGVVVGAVGLQVQHPNLIINNNAAELHFFLIVANHLQPSGLESNSEAGDDHEDTREEEDEDEEDRAALHSDPVLDQESEDVPGGG